MTWKVAFVQLLVINLFVCKVYRVADAATVVNATESAGNNTAEVAVGNNTTKNKGVPLKVFVTEIDASKFFRNRNTCSIVYCVGPIDYKEEKRNKIEEKRERNQEKIANRREIEEEKRSRRRELEEEKRSRHQEIEEERREHHQEHEEKRAELREAHREAARERWNQMLEELKQ